MKIVASAGNILRNWIGGGVWVWRYAPLLLLPILLTEGAQHVAEIQLGMFESKAAFRALAMDSTRWIFGYAKAAGFILSILLVARGVALGSQARAFWPRWRALILLAVVIAATYAIGWGLGSSAAKSIAPATLLAVIDGILQILLFIPICALLFGDSWADVRRTSWRVILALLLMLLLAATAFAPLQWLHMMNHKWALGTPMPVVWALMAFDTLVVGMMSAFVGSGLATGWRAIVGKRRDYQRNGMLMEAQPAASSHTIPPMTRDATGNPQPSL